MASKETLNDKFSPESEGLFRVERQEPTWNAWPDDVEQGPTSLSFLFCNRELTLNPPKRDVVS